MITDTFLTLLEKDTTVKRDLVKTVSWRILGTIDTVMLGWLITGEISTGAKIGSLELFTKMVLYFFHERVWHNMSYGLLTKSGKAEKIKKENASVLFAHNSQIMIEQREALNGHKAFTIWLTGLSASGKSSIASELDCYLFNANVRSFVIDGDNTRMGVNSDLSFSKEDRSENIRRVAEICKLFNDAGIITIASFISPYMQDRAKAAEIIHKHRFIEVFVDADISICKARDKKGLYKLAEEGKIKDFTGVNGPYEKPMNPDIHLVTNNTSVQECASKIAHYIVGRLNILNLNSTNTANA